MSDDNSEESLKEDASTQLLYEQLQSEYNKLLKRHAAAENTIDELRTGATVHLYTEPLESRPNSRLSFDTARFPQSINFPRPLQASTSEFSTMNDTRSTSYTSGGRRTPVQRENTRENLFLQDRIQALKEDVNTVEIVFSESDVNDKKTPKELFGICTQLYTEHGRLTRELKLQSRDTLSISLQSDASSFSTKTEMQRELYRIGLRIEELQGDIVARLKTGEAKNEEKSPKPANDEKPSHRPDLECVVKEMEDSKGAKNQNCEDVLARLENTKTENVVPARKHSEPKPSVVESHYLAASPENMESPPNAFSGFKRSQHEAEQSLNMTWPPSRDAADSDIHLLRHSFSAPPAYGQSTPDPLKANTARLDGVHSLGNFSPSNRQTFQNTGVPGKDTVNGPSYYRREKQPTHLDKSTPPRLSETRKHSRNSEEEVADGMSDLTSTERERINQHSFGRSPGYSSYSSPNVHYRTDSKDADDEGNGRLYSEDTREHSPYLDEDTTYDSDKQLPKRSDRERKESLNLRNTAHSRDFQHEPVRRKDKQAQLPKRAEKTDQSTEQRTRSINLGARKFNSMSSLAESSRMSTPLFQPRGTTRGSTHSTRDQHAPRYKRRTLSDAFDSGLGSEASRSLRLTTDLSDGVRKLNVSNQWDSTLQLDLVSESNENEATAELMSTNDEPAADNGRQPPKKDRRSSKQEIIFTNSSPNPPSAAERSSRTPTGYFTYRTSRDRLPSNDDGHSGHSLPVHNTDGASLSRDPPRLERRPSSGHASSVEETSHTHTDRHRKNSQSATPEVLADSRASCDTVRAPARTNDLYSERKLQALRNELDSLHEHVNKLHHPRATMDMYDELRDYDEQLRRSHERRHERKLDELRQTMEQLKNDIKFRNKKDRRKHNLETEVYEDFRSELRKVKEKLDEMAELRNVPVRSIGIQNTHESSSESLNSHYSRYDDEIAKRFSNLVRKVDDLRLRVENTRDSSDTPRETPRHFCRICQEADIHYHCHRTVSTADHLPRTSTPFVSDAHQGRDLTAKDVHRSYQSSASPDAKQQQFPVVHHIHTYHQGPALKQHYETDSDDDVTRIPRRKRGVHRTRHRSKQDALRRDHLALDEARKAAWDVQRLSKNILNTISLDLTSLRS